MRWPARQLGGEPGAHTRRKLRRLWLRCYDRSHNGPISMRGEKWFRCSGNWKNEDFLKNGFLENDVYLKEKYICRIFTQISLGRQKKYSSKTDATLSYTLGQIQAERLSRYRSTRTFFVVASFCLSTKVKCSSLYRLRTTLLPLRKARAPPITFHPRGSFFQFFSLCRSSPQLIYVAL